MKINIEEIWTQVNKRKKWNSVPLSDIEFFEHGKKIEINPELVEEFEFIGMNNIDFITTGFYKHGWDKKDA